MNKTFLSYSRNALLMLASFAVTYLVAELVIRLAYEDKYAPRPEFFQPNEDLGWVTNTNLNHNFYGLDFSTHIQTDEDGYRLGARGPVNEGDKIVVFVGDSFTFGWGVSGNQTFASRFDELLSRIDGNMRVVNIAVPGYGTLEISKRLDDFLEKINNDDIHMVVIFHHFNDPRGNFRHLLFESGFLEPYKHPRIRERSASHLYNFSRVQMDKGFASKTPAPDTIDVLFPFPLRPTSKKTGNIFVETGWEIARTDIDLKAETKDLLWNRGKLPELHRELVTFGINKINQSTGSIPTYHAVINYSPPWFENEMEGCFDAAKTLLDNHHYIGKLEVDAASQDEMLNKHSGGHFTPVFNKLYAEQLFETLKPAISD